MGAADVRAVRRRTGLSPAKFAERFRLTRRGREQPGRAARFLLLTSNRHPEAVTNALAA
jgi:DNA-binding transcriptional regulator YiaG